MSNFNLAMRTISLVLILIFLSYMDSAYETGNELRAIYDMSKAPFAFSAWSWIVITFKDD